LSATAPTIPAERKLAPFVSTRMASAQLEDQLSTTPSSGASAHLGSNPSAPIARVAQRRSPARLLRQPLAVALRLVAISAVRSFLSKRGYVLTRTDRAASNDLRAYVTGLVHRGIAFEKIHIWDSDAEPVRILYSLFPSEVLSMCSLPEFDPLTSVATLGDRVLLQVDACVFRQFPVDSLAAMLKSARVVIVRSKPEYFTNQAADTAELASFFNQVGFRFHDVLQRPCDSVVTAGSENIYLAFERTDISDADAKTMAEARRQRVAEALVYFSSPIVSRSTRPPIAGRGSFGIFAGVSNPGAISHRGRVILLARGEKLPWVLQKRSWSDFAASSQPMLLELDSNQKFTAASEVRFQPTPDLGRSRAEDFRLFAHAGRLYSNHTVVGADAGTKTDSPVVPESLPAAVGVSHFDPESRQLTYLGAPRLDRSVGRVEKNWAMFSTGENVHLIYSVAPYRLFSCAKFPTLEFTATCERPVNLHLPDDALPVRNSINPVPYDATHYFHLVHKVYPTKQYVFWAVLIDRTTLLPVYVTDRPILRGTASARASILYACSAVVTDTDISLFGGVDDCSITSWQVSRSTLQRHWRQVL
jgi:hypothetical protein